ncbi:hypothetical protein F3Y22_tig00111848pilonHSYRG00208 [Hibiscus syriacus]|uniref:DUF659 domain-containing protein n=1 Tax=Hibiscus syriacus TaxID=106335 RepID=A0A6A2XQR1_HIBSY|nr:hypothetical protein F3Y22_tig00111848pilonHSYRG00208 [Hibiscus syriacus]
MTSENQSSTSSKQDIAWKYCIDMGKAHVREEIREYMEKKCQNKKEAEVVYDFDDVDNFGDDEDDEVVEVGICVRKSGNNTSKVSNKQKGIKGPIDMFFTPPPEQVMKSRKDGKMKQPSINEACKKQIREKACMELSNWFFDVGLAFDAPNYDSFTIATEAVAQCGTCFKPPTYQEIRVPFLIKEVKATDEMVKQVHHEQWAKYGCSIMSDGWRDSVAYKGIINFLVNSPKGSIFIKSIDASDIVKNVEQLFIILDDMVEEVVRRMSLRW